MFIISNIFAGNINGERYCSAPIQNSTSRLPSRPWFVYQKWNPVGHGQEVTEGMVGEKKKRGSSFHPRRRQDVFGACRVFCLKISCFFANSHCHPLLN
jgi:hypothetical protein